MAREETIIACSTNLSIIEVISSPWTYYKHVNHLSKKKCFLPLGETFNLAEKSSSELHTQVSFVCLGRWMTSSNLARNSSQYTYYEMRISSAHLYKPRYWPIYSKATKGRNVTRTAYTLWNGRKHELTFTCPGSKRAHICRTHPDQAKRKYQEVPHWCHHWLL